MDPLPPISHWWSQDEKELATGSWATEKNLETILKYISIIEVTGLAYIAPVMGSREQANKENSHNLHV